jgi:nucleoside-diphosphate-sugar epimerase
MNWRGTRVVVTGGASFIGSTLVDALVKQYASVRVIDNLSSGKKEYLAEHMKTGAISFIEGDLNDSRMTREAILGRDVVFHLAADHGGRGYVDRHQADCATNLGLDGIVFKACLDAKVKQTVFASSGCIYPVHLQTNLKEELLLTETMAGPPYNPDKMYGLAKMAGELTLKAFYEDYGLKSASCRFFTVYGPRGKEDHAIMAMLARAFIRQDPFVIWGLGDAVRNWTHVDDIVSGLLLSAEHIHDASAVNLGTTERITVLQAAKMACVCFDHHPEFQFLPKMPVGPLNRVSDNTRAFERMGWKPTVPFSEGIVDTAEWYAETHNRAEVEKTLESRLLAR